MPGCALELLGKTQLRSIYLVLPRNCWLHPDITETLLTVKNEIYQQNLDCLEIIKCALRIFFLYLRLLLLQGFCSTVVKNYTCRFAILKFQWVLAQYQMLDLRV